LRNDFLPLSRPHITNAEINEISEVLESGHLTTGPKVTEFEDSVKEYIGKGIYAVALNSCTAGLYLSLLANGIGEGDEVILPTWTFVATGHVVVWTGAKPILCDINESSLTLMLMRWKILLLLRRKLSCRFILLDILAIWIR